jgi:tripartite-type tricarboxylate transporter receptor subunit TctC
MSMARSIGTAIAAMLIAHSPAVDAQASASGAESWPSRPIRLIVGSAPGSSPDVVARLIGQKLGEVLKQPVVVDNRTGAFSNIAMEAVARAAPDGYTLLLGIPTVSINPHLYPLSFDPIAELAPVAQLTSVTFTLIANTDFAPRSVPEIIAEARAKPGTVICAWSGPIPHFACELLRLRGQVDINVVPYKSGPAALNDLLGGRVNLMFDVTNVVVPQARANRVRPIATINPARGTGPFGDLPTVSETFPGFEFVTWQGVFAPAKTPRPIINRLNREIGAILDDPDMRKRLADGGVGAVSGTVEAFEAMVKRDYATYGKIIRDAGIKAD